MEIFVLVRLRLCDIDTEIEIREVNWPLKS